MVDARQDSPPCICSPCARANFEILMHDLRMSEEWKIEHGPDGAKIILDGKILTEEKEILEFIDTHFEKPMLDELKKKLLSK